jgi:hypothetical protein
MWTVTLTLRGDTYKDRDVLEKQYQLERIDRLDLFQANDATPKAQLVNGKWELFTYEGNGGATIRPLIEDLLKEFYDAGNGATVRDLNFQAVDECDTGILYECYFELWTDAGNYGELTRLVNAEIVDENGNGPEIGGGK